MSAQAAFSRSWRVGRYRVELSCPVPKPQGAVGAVMEWHPEIPTRLTPNELAEYRAGRAAALRELADELGVRVRVIDL